MFLKKKKDFCEILLHFDSHGLPGSDGLSLLFVSPSLTVNNSELMTPPGCRAFIVEIILSLRLPSCSSAASLRSPDPSVLYQIASTFHPLPTSFLLLLFSLHNLKCNSFANSPCATLCFVISPTASAEEVSHSAECKSEKK